jgi:hypothetical protein
VGPSRSFLPKWVQVALSCLGNFHTFRRRLGEGHLNVPWTMTDHCTYRGKGTFGALVGPTNPSRDASTNDPVLVRGTGYIWTIVGTCVMKVSSRIARYIRVPSNGLIVRFNLGTKPATIRFIAKGRIISTLFPIDPPVLPIRV